MRSPRSRLHRGDPMAMAAEIPAQSQPQRVQPKPLPAGVTIKVRRLKFDYPDTAESKDWAGHNPALSRFMEGLSMLFPEGERFFVESVNRFKDQIVDPVLRKQASAFAAQEGMHAAEHHKYNVRAA